MSCECAGVWTVAVVFGQRCRGTAFCMLGTHNQTHVVAERYQTLLLTVSQHTGFVVVIMNYVS